MTLKSFTYRTVVALQIIHEAWGMLWDYLVKCTSMGSGEGRIYLYKDSCSQIILTTRGLNDDITRKLLLGMV